MNDETQINIAEVLRRVNEFLRATKGDSVISIGYSPDGKTFGILWGRKLVVDDGSSVEHALELFLERFAPEPTKANTAKNNPPVLPHFNPNDCGGVYDGHGVISDADPGL